MGILKLGEKKIKWFILFLKSEGLFKMYPRDCGAGGGLQVKKKKSFIPLLIFL